jgi:hypothetical protein
MGLLPFARQGKKKYLNRASSNRTNLDVVQNNFLYFRHVRSYIVSQSNLQGIRMHRFLSIEADLPATKASQNTS